jgi:hypothetical protein
MIVAADDVRDSHIGIVDDNGEIVRRRAIRAGNYQIIELGILEDHPAPHLVVDNNLTILRIPESHNGVDTDARLFSVAATTVIAYFTPARHLPGATRLELFLSAITAVRLARLKPLIGNFFIAIESMRLEKRALVGIQTQPGQAIEDCVNIFFS